MLGLCMVTCFVFKRSTTVLTSFFLFFVGGHSCGHSYIFSPSAVGQVSFVLTQQLFFDSTIMLPQLLWMKTGKPSEQIQDVSEACCWWWSLDLKGNATLLSLNLTCGDMRQILQLLWVLRQKFEQGWDKIKSVFVPER